MAWNHKGITIDIERDGSFSATIGTVLVRGGSLAECKAQIDNEAKGSLAVRKTALHVVGVLADDRHPDSAEVYPCVITGLNRTTRLPMVDDLPKGHDLGQIIPDTPANRALLAEFIEARKRERTVRKQVDLLTLRSSGYGRIELGDYEAHLKQMESDYAAKLALSKGEKSNGKN